MKICREQADEIARLKRNSQGRNSIVVNRPGSSVPVAAALGKF